MDIRMICVMLPLNVNSASAARARLAQLQSLQVRSIFSFHGRQLRMEDFMSGVQV